MEKTKKVTKKEKVEEKNETKHIGLRTLGIIILVILAIFIGITIRKFYLINTYILAMAEYAKSNNYYIEITNDNVRKIQQYYKDGKSVAIMTPTDTRMLYTYYDSKTKESIIRFDSDGDKVALVSVTDNKPVPTVQIVQIYGNEMTTWQKLLTAALSRVRTEEYNGKECYKIETQGMKVWIDKETYLTVGLTSGYMKNSDGTEEPMITNYEYEFGTVTDEQVAKPDLTGYKVQEQ